MEREEEREPQTDFEEGVEKGEPEWDTPEEEERGTRSEPVGENGSGDGDEERSVFVVCN